MFRHIMVPVDLAEKEKLGRALEVAVDLAQHYRARITLISVAGGLQAKVSHSPEKYARLLAAFAQEVGAPHGLDIGSHVYITPDPSVELDQKLLTVIEEIGADLIVVASHQPGWMEYFINSHGGRLASHAPISVFVVRG